MDGQTPNFTGKFGCYVNITLIHVEEFGKNVKLH